MLRLLLAGMFVTTLLVISNSDAQQSQLSDSVNAAKISDSKSKNYNNNQPLRIAVAANFTPVLKILLTDFTKKTGINTQVISGASGAMYLQIKHGAPFDIFLSADTRRPKELEHAGYAVIGSRKTYAIGQLAFYSSTTATASSLGQVSIADLSANLLTNPPARFAIANPDTAPYGKAAKETLMHLGLWQSYQSRLITGINIGQTFAQLRSKAVSSGIVANSQLVLNNLAGIIIPGSYHQPIEQQLMIINASKQQHAAKQLSDFLLSANSQEIIVSYGYTQVNNTHNR